MRNHFYDKYSPKVFPSVLSSYRFLSLSLQHVQTTVEPIPSQSTVRNDAKLKTRFWDLRQKLLGHNKWRDIPQPTLFSSSSSPFLPLAQQIFQLSTIPPDSAAALSLPNPRYDEASSSAVPYCFPLIDIPLNRAKTIQRGCEWRQMVGGKLVFLPLVGDLQKYYLFICQAPSFFVLPVCF